MTQTIITHPQSSFKTKIPTGDGYVTAVVTAKEYIVNRLRSGQWQTVNQLTQRGKMSYDGARGRISELRQSGYVFESRRNSRGETTAVRLISFPGTAFHATQ